MPSSLPPPAGSLEALEALFEEQRRPSTIDVHRALAATEARLFDRQPPPLTLGRYVLLARIGHGAHGVVHAAYDPVLDRKVAIKLIRTGSSATDTALVQEARTACRVQHGHVVAIFDAGRYDALDLSGGERQPQEVPENGVFVVMELVEGEDLATWLHRNQPQWPTIVEVVLGAARGLAAAHACGVVHLDVKPLNVLVTADALAKVVDFSIARHPAATEGVDIRGTLPYMAPEQHVGNAQLDARADQYGLCVALYEALYGALPFVADDPGELLASKQRGLRGTPPRSRVPEAIWRVLRRGLEPRPHDRFADMHALVHALERARRRRKVLLALGLSAAVPITGAWLLSGFASACVGVDDELAEVWHPKSRGAVHERLAAFDRPYAAATASTVVRELDEHAEQWRRAKLQSCRAELDAAASAPGTSLCLDLQRAQLGETIARLRSADENTLLGAHRLLDQLRRPSECDGLPTIAADESVRAEIVEIERLSARADNAAATQDLTTAQTFVDDATTRAETIAAPATLARVYLTRARVLAAATRNDEAFVALHEALSQAERGHDDATATQALIALLGLTGVRQHRFAEAYRYADWAAARIDRAQLGWWPRTQQLHYLGETLTHERRIPEAIAALTSARELIEEHLGPDHPALAGIERSLGVAAFFGGDEERSRLHVHRALEVYTERLGPDHPDVLSMRGNVGVFAKRQGDYREALTATQAVRDGLEAVLDPDDARVVAIRHQLANVLFVFGRTDDALAMLDVVLEQRRRILGPDDLSVVATHLLAAEVALADGRLGRGERELSAASRLSTRLRPPDRVGELEHDVLMVGLLRARGQLEPAAELAQRERDETEPAKELLARLDVLAGAIACDLGRHEHGAIRLRAAITAVPPRMQHFEIVRARFELARCLTPHAPATARRELSELLDDVRRRGLEGPHVEQIERTLSDL